MNRLQPTARRLGLEQHPAKLQRHPHHRPAPVSPRLGRSDRIRIAVLDPGDSDALLAMLGRCSPMTLYHRFHGITDGVAYARHVLATADGHDSYLAWSDDRCVGVGSLHVGANQAEIGVLVEDGWQRRGVGTALLTMLVGRARQLDLSSLRADVLGEIPSPSRYWAESARPGPHWRPATTRCSSTSELARHPIPARPNRARRAHTASTRLGGKPSPRLPSERARKATDEQSPFDCRPGHRTSSPNCEKKRSNTARSGTRSPALGGRPGQGGRFGARCG